MGNTSLSLIGGILAGTGFGSLITIIIKHFLDKSKMKAERLSNLQREIFFNLQKQAEGLFIEMNQMTKQAFIIQRWSNGNASATDIPHFDMKERIKRISSAQVYFTKNTVLKYKKLTDVFVEIVESHIGIEKPSDITPKHRDMRNQLYNKYIKAFDKCEASIFEEIRVAKSKII